ncbi:rod shape-determining protein RodA [Halalkalibacter hemicellulosilyticus]|uniref:Cell division protein FtsW n=1 Tax=Halalkalibacter hemicellulosilyticusJCM 9152 TaxID=1236971 RepID=W4QLZ0_9BACI|nr:rod shape-determining protein RodA [Halalkalibacter hemicellulosilyticus]GAE32364.1 cell division protein FtsW [Halalkalibacter hemicellulosilyticusJCM 9152]
MEERKTPFQQLDYTLLFLMFVLMCISLLAIYSGVSGSTQYALVPSAVVTQQLVFYAAGFIIMIGMLFVDYDLFKSFSIPLYFLSLIALILVSFTPLGVHRNGATRWLDLGFAEPQPSEIMKIVLIIILAHMLFNITHHRVEKDLKSDLVIVFKVLAVGLPPFFLVLQQPDLGTALVIASVIATMLLLSGVAWRILFALGLSAVAGLLGLIYLHNTNYELFSKFIAGHQLERIYGWLDPYEYQGSFGYQLVMAIRGIGSGQLYGAGFMQGVQTQSDIVPEIHTDFIFTVIGEEFGFFGAVILIVTYFLLFYRMIIIALTCNNLFGTYLVSGVIGLLVFQVFQNIAMTIGLMPITGLALPFISYGGSALMTNMIAMGIVLNVNMRTKHYMFESDEESLS